MITRRIFTLASLVFLLTSATVCAQFAPQIITHPASQGVVPGSSVFFSVNASGTAPLAYQWRKNSLDLGGATAGSYTLNNVTTNDEANYTVRVSNASGAVTSQVATLTVYVAPSILTQPQGRTNAQGSNVTFTVLASGTAPLSYQWKKDGANIPGATLNGYSINNLQPSDSGNYSVTVGNPAGSVNSASAILQVLVRPSISAQPQNQTVLVGQTATFSVTAAGSDPLTYRWRWNGNNFLPFAQGPTTNSTLTITNNPTSFAGNYTCVVTNGAGSITSSVAVLTVNVPPTITGQPASRTVGEGSNTTFGVAASGPSLSYQWRKDGTPIPGATASSLPLNNVQFTNTGGYSCVVTNPFAAVTSTVATLTVIRIPPSIVTQPQSQSVPGGGTAAFSVTAGGTTLAYEWRKNDQTIPGANASAYTFTNAALADTGDFTVVITNLVGGITSTVAMLTVGYPPVFTAHPVAQTNLPGGSVTFSGAVTGSPPLTLQWLKDGVPLPAQTNATLALTNLQPPQIGYYRLTAANPFGTALSSNAALNLTGYDFPEFHGLVAYYPFNGNANDESGNGNNGIVNGASLSADRFGDPGNAFGFGGTNFIEIPDNAVFDAPSFTASMWFNVDQFVGNGVFDQAMFLISKGQNNFELHLGSPGVSGPTGIRFLPRVGSGANWDTPPAAYTTNRWHHIVTAYDPPTGGIAVFVDGRNLPLIGPSTLPASPDNSFNAWIGMRNFGTGPSFGTPARIDDVRIYKRALSSNEIWRLYVREADLPVILQQPAPQTLAPNGTATFNVTATATLPLAYQWHKDGVPIPGATNSTLLVSNAQPQHIGYYSVGVSNGLSGIVSTGAALNLNGNSFVEWGGLVAHYPLDGTAADATANHLDFLTTPAFSYGRLGANPGASAFTTPAPIFTPNLSLGPNGFSVSLWLKLNSIPSAFGERVLMHGDYNLPSSDPGSGLFGLAVWADGRCAITAPDAANQGHEVIAPAGTITTNRWYHIACYADGTTLGMAIDGVPIGSIASSLATKTAPVVLGGNASYYFVSGFVDDVRIYNRGLTALEAVELFTREAIGDGLAASAQWTPGGLAVRFPAAPHVAYSILYATNLPAVSWQKLADVPSAPTNRLAEVLDPSITNTAQRFYRVVAPPISP